MAVDNKFVFIKDLRPGLKNVTCVFIVIDKGSVNTTKDGSVVRKCRVADKTASIIFSLWNEQADAIESGDILKLVKGYASLWKGTLMLNSGKYGVLEKVGEFTMVYSELPDMSDQTQDFAQQQQHPPPPHSHAQTNLPVSANNTSPGGAHYGARGGGRERDGSRGGGRAGELGGNRNGNNSSSNAAAPTGSATLRNSTSLEGSPSGNPLREDGISSGSGLQLKEVQRSEASLTPPHLQHHRLDSHTSIPRTIQLPPPASSRDHPNPHFTPHPSPPYRPTFDASSPPFPPVPSPARPPFHQARPPPPFRPHMRGGNRFHPYPRPQASIRAQDPRGVWR